MPLQAIFRGFLLASLARYMSVQAAVVASSLLFAMCHFRLQVGPELCEVALGAWESRAGHCNMRT